MLLRELLADPGLGLTLLHGEQSLDRRLLSVTTIDLLDPRRYVRPGALVLSGLMWHRGADDSETFVQALAETDVVALAAGEAALGSVPQDLVEACRRHDVALLKVPVEVAFSEITDRVAVGREAETGRRLAAALDRQRRLLSAVAEGRGLPRLLSLVGDAVGVRCRVLTPAGRDLAAVQPPLPAHDVDALTRAALVEDRLPAVVVSSGATYSVLRVGPGLAQRVTAWFLVCDGDHRNWADDVRTAVEELASAVELERTRLDDAGRVERRIADEVLALVAAGGAARPETVARMRDVGLEPSDSFLVVVAGLPGRPELLADARTVLADLCLVLTGRVMVGIHENRAIAMVAAAGPDDVMPLRAALARLEPGLGRARFAVGVSAVSGPDALSGALDEARHAQRLAALRGGPTALIAADELTSYVVMLAAVPDDVRRVFAGRVLGPVLDHDARHRSGLLATLRAFLDADGSWSRCAAAQHVHVNTVRYRIGRVETLTGRDLSRLEDRIDLFLALRSLPEAHRTGTPPTP